MRCYTSEATTREIQLENSLCCYVCGRVLSIRTAAFKNPCKQVKREKEKKWKITTARIHLYHCGSEWNVWNIKTKHKRLQADHMYVALGSNVKIVFDTLRDNLKLWKNNFASSNKFHSYSLISHAVARKCLLLEVLINFTTTFTFYMKINSNEHIVHLTEHSMD